MKENVTENVSENQRENERENETVTTVRHIVAVALGGRSQMLLAVSGGLDSMSLLDAAASVCASDQLVVATFDHGTSSEATAACALVAARAAELGLRCESGVARSRLISEADLRHARWEFLRAVAFRTGASVVTAHTRDDHLETVMIRVLRSAGARGLAALYSDSDIARPFLAVTRATLAQYARARGVRWIEDPSNASRAYLRNRVRHDLLPAMLAVRPPLERELLALSRRAADVRREIEEVVDRWIEPQRATRGRGVDVAAARLTTLSDESLAAVWPAIVARAGLVIDRRGLARLVAFTRAGGTGRRIQLSGGWCVIRARECFEVRRLEGSATTMTSLSLSNVTSHGDWRFRRTDEAADENAWTAWLPTDQPLAVRGWRAGDTLTDSSLQACQKVKRLLSKMGLTGHKRASWPVVLSGNQIVWVPGVRRSRAASDRSGRSGLPFVCEYVNS